MISCLFIFNIQYYVFDVVFDVEYGRFYDTHGSKLSTTVMCGLSFTIKKWYVCGTIHYFWAAKSGMITVRQVRKGRMPRRPWSSQLRWSLLFYPPSPPKHPQVPRPMSSCPQVSTVNVLCIDTNTTRRMVFRASVFLFFFMRRRITANSTSWYLQCFLKVKNENCDSILRSPNAFSNFSLFSKGFYHVLCIWPTKRKGPQDV